MSNAIQSIGMLSFGEFELNNPRIATGRRCRSWSSGRGSIRGACLTGLCLGWAPPFSLAQSSDPPAVAATTAPSVDSPEPKADGRKAAEEALRSARELLDRFDEHRGENPSAAELEELNRYILVLQATDPANAWLSYIQGRAYAYGGRNGDAIDQLRRFVETRDGRSEWKAFRALGDAFIGEFPRLARANYERAAELNPSEPSVLMGLSICAGRTGDIEEALRLARRAVESDGRRSVRYVNHLARTLSVMKERSEAEREALSALRLAEDVVRNQPGERGPLQSLAAQLDLLMDIVGERINDSADAGADDFVRLAEYMARRAETADQLARHDRLAVLQRGMDATAADSSPRLLQEYAAALADVGRNDDAIAQFERLLKLKPEDPVALEWLTRLRTPTEITPRSQPQ